MTMTGKYSHTTPTTSLIISLCSHLTLSAFFQNNTYGQPLIQSEHTTTDHLLIRIYPLYFFNDYCYFRIISIVYLPIRSGHATPTTSLITSLYMHLFILSPFLFQNNICHLLLTQTKHTTPDHLLNLHTYPL